MAISICRYYCWWRYQELNLWRNDSSTNGFHWSTIHIAPCKTVRFSKNEFPDRTRKSEISMQFLWSPLLRSVIIQLNINMQKENLRNGIEAIQKWIICKYNQHKRQEKFNLSRRNNRKNSIQQKISVTNRQSQLKISAVIFHPVCQGNAVVVRSRPAWRFLPWHRRPAEPAFLPCTGRTPTLWELPRNTSSPPRSSSFGAKCLQVWNKKKRLINAR